MNWKLSSHISCPRSHNSRAGIETHVGLDLTLIGATRRLRLTGHTGHHLLQAWSQFNVATS